MVPPESSIRDVGDRQVGVYLQFLIVSLRFSAPSFIGDVCRVYKIHITQMIPNGVTSQNYSPKILFLI